MVEYSTPLHDRDGEGWTDLVDEAGEPLQQHIPASSTPSGGSRKMGWSYVRGVLLCLHMWHGLLSYRIVSSGVAKYGRAWRSLPQRPPGGRCLSFHQRIRTATAV